MAYKLQESHELPFAARKYPTKVFQLAVLESGFTFQEERDSIELCYSEFPIMHLDQELGGWIPIPGPAYDIWAEIYLAQIDLALKNEADIICAGEFGLPIQESVGPSIDIGARVTDLLKTYQRPLLFLAGSRHSPSRVFDGPNSTLSNENVAEIYAHDPIYGSEKSQPILQRKRSPAMKIGERIFTPKEREIPIYSTPFGNLSILICSDAFDSRILFSFLRENPARHPKAQIIFVPSFNKSDLLIESCKYLSYLANCAVVYLNSHDCHFPEKGVKFFVAGVESADVPHFVDCHSHLFSSDRQLNRELRDWVCNERAPTVTKEFSHEGRTVTINRKVALFTIDTILAQNFASGAASAAGAMLETALSVGREFSV